MFAVAASAGEPVPSWLNSGLNNRDLTLSPDGDMLLTTVMSPTGQFSVIVLSRRIEGRWQELEIAPFSGKHADIEPMFSPDGHRVFFASRRPRRERGGDDWDIWFVTRTGDTWSKPENPGPPVNSPGNEFYPSIAAGGNLYFTAERDDGAGAEDIFRAIAEDGRYTRVENAGPGVNSSAFEFNAYVSADERFIIFGSQGRPGETGGGDLYVSFADEQGRFSEARLLSGGVNSSQLDYCPFVHGGRLYFTSRRMGKLTADNYATLKRALESPGNGLGDIYSIALDDIPEFSGTR